VTEKAPRALLNGDISCYDRPRLYSFTVSAMDILRISGLFGTRNSYLFGFEASDLTQRMRFNPREYEEDEGQIIFFGELY
jgi:hypothetical protein